MTRTLALLIPLVAVGIAAWRMRPDRRQRGAALLALIAAVIGVGGLNAVAGAAGWWSYQDVAGSALGSPVDLWLGWAVLWGPLFVLVRMPLPVALIALAWLDVLTMPLLAPLVGLGPMWMLGEAIGLLLVAAPAILLGRWCADARRLPARAALQLVVFSGLLLWFGPAIAIDQGDGAWRNLLDLPYWQLALVAQLALLAALPGLLAMREFVERGGGTPYPWDPPTRLVTTGPYAYVANPMQLSAILLTTLMAVAIRSWALAACIGFAVAFSAAVAGPHESDDLARRHGAAWAGYRRQVRNWRPRWTPYLAHPARLYLGATCDVCSSTAHAVSRLRPQGLSFHPAEQYAGGLVASRPANRPCERDDPRPSGLVRARYEGPDGYWVDGVAAVSRGLEHVNLAWAVVGWFLRLPGLDRLAQIIVDGVGGQPRELKGGAAWPTPGRS
jgi:protein-S-isoprenylcysteine O-methyltransferase Ste14